MATGGDDGDFKYGIWLENCGEAYLQNVIMNGRKDGEYFTGFYITATSPGMSYSFVGCSVYSGIAGCDILNTVSPGIEGVKFTDCDFVNVQYGVRFVNERADYGPPQLTWIGGHMNIYQSAIYTRHIPQIFISNSLFYNQGQNATGKTIDLDICNTVSIASVQFISIYDCKYDAIYIGVADRGIIYGNQFELHLQDTTKSGVYLSENATNFIVTNNLMQGAGTIVTDIIPKDNPAQQNFVNNNFKTI